MKWTGIIHTGRGWEVWMRDRRLSVGWDECG